MAEKIFKATGLRIESNKLLPQAVCRKCERTVESIISFQEKVIESQHVFNTDSTVKKIIDMSPSQEKLSEGKKLATDKQVCATDKQVSSSRRLRFDDISKISDVLPQQAGVTVRHVIPSTSNEVVKRSVSVKNVKPFTIWTNISHTTTKVCSKQIG